MKLYHRTSRLRFLRYVPKWFHKRLKWALSLKPGDLVNDCSGFNHTIATIEPVFWTTQNGWFITNVEFTMVEGPCCSLRHCGVCEPKSREDIEKRQLEFMNYWMTSPHGAATWYGGLDNPEYKKEIDELNFKWEALKNEFHICDEHGIPYKDIRQWV